MADPIGPTPSELIQIEEDGRLASFSSNFDLETTTLGKLFNIDDGAGIGLNDGMVPRYDLGTQTYNVEYPMLNDSSDVNLTGATVGDILVYGGVNWTPQAPVSTLPDFFGTTGANLLNVPGVWTNVDTLNAVVTVDSKFMFSLNFKFNISLASQDGQFRYRFDGGAWENFQIEVKDSNNLEPFSYSFPIDLLVGAHTVEFEAQKQGGANMDITKAFLTLQTVEFL